MSDRMPYEHLSHGSYHLLRRHPCWRINRAVPKVLISPFERRRGLVTRFMLPKKAAARPCVTPNPPCQSTTHRRQTYTAQLLPPVKDSTRGGGHHAPAQPSVNLGPCPNPQWRRSTKKAPPKMARLGQPRGLFVGHTAKKPLRSYLAPVRVAAAGSKLVIALSQPASYLRGPTGWSGYRPIFRHHAHCFPERVLAENRLRHSNWLGPSPCKSFGGADGGEYAAFSGRGTSSSGRRTSCVPWPVRGRLRTACPRILHPTPLPETERPHLKPANSPVSGIRWGLHSAGTTSKCKEGPSGYTRLTGLATDSLSAT